MVEKLHRGARAGKGFRPIDRHEMVGGGVIAQGVGQATCILQIMIAPLPQFGNAVPREKVGINALDGRFPSNGLCAIFAKFERGRVLGIGPCAAGAVEAVGLVHLEECARVGAGAHLIPHRLRHGTQRTPASCRAGIGPHAFHSLRRAIDLRRNIPFRGLFRHYSDPPFWHIGRYGAQWISTGSSAPASTRPIG